MKPLEYKPIDSKLRPISNNRSVLWTFSGLSLRNREKKRIILGLFGAIVLFALVVELFMFDSGPLTVDRGTV